MTQDEILQYNKRCAEFLGVTLHESQLTMPHSHFTGYHSDWNWIMKVVEAIEKLIFNVRITIACVTIENAFDNDSNLSPIYKFHSIQGEFQTKKEAVVQAINQFLIWYEQSMKTSKSCK